jgi:hypothetical protein
MPMRVVAEPWHRQSALEFGAVLGDVKSKTLQEPEMLPTMKS